MDRRQLDIVWELVQEVPFLLGLLGIALLVVLGYLAWRLARAAESASYAELGHDRGDLETEEGELALVDLRGSASVGPLERSFRRVHGLVRRLVPERGARYRLPFFLALGPSHGGKSTLLGETGLSLPFGIPGDARGTDPPGLSWWLFDRAVVMDLDGELVLPQDRDSADSAPWLSFLRLLRKHRPRRPLDGIVLVLPASELAAFDPEDRDTPARLARRADLLRRRLWRAQEKLGLKLPVSVVVSRCDRLPGFADFLAVLSAEERRQIFGWSNPDPPAAGYQAGYIDTIFTRIRRALARIQLRELGGAATERDLVAFPAAFDELREALRIHLNQIFSPSSAYEPFPLRGVYFCGGEGFAEAVSPHQLPGEPKSSSVAREGDDRHPRVHFLADLFARKIFPEGHLATPTKEAQTWRGRWSWGLQCAFFLLLFGGPLALFWGHHSTSRAADALCRDLLAPLGQASCLGEEADVPPSPPVAGEAARARIFFRAASRLEDYRLRSAWLPASWWTSYGADVDRLAGRLYREDVFPSIRHGLEARAAQLDELPGRLASPEAVWGIESTPEFHVLVAATDTTLRVDHDARLYNCFLPPRCEDRGEELLARLQELARRSLGLAPRPPTGAARDFHADALERLYLEDGPFALDADNLRREVERFAAARMYARLFGENVVVLGAESVRRQVDRLALASASTSEGTEAYRGLLDALDALAKNLDRSELAWIWGESFEPGGAFDPWLRRLMASDSLGPELGRRIKELGDEGLRKLQRRLAGLQTEALGPLLARDGDSDRLVLAEPVTGLQVALTSLLEERYMKPEAGSPQLANTPSGNVLFWRLPPLERATSTLGSYESFLSEGLDAFAGLGEATRQASRGPLEDHVLDLVAEAQEFRTRPSTITRERLEAHLLDRVVNLQTSSDLLGDLLASLEAPPRTDKIGGCDVYCLGRPATAWCQLSAVLETQQAEILEDLDRLLELEGLYTARGDGFAWWDGAEPPAPRAFGVETAADLESYLTSQLQRVDTLARQVAQPVFAVPTTDCWGFSARPSERRWRLVVEDLEDVENERPGNAVAVLEELVKNDMTAATVDTCLDELAPETLCFAETTPRLLRRRPPCDYFLDARTRLVSQAAARCEELVVAAAEEAYGEIAAAFINRLDGKFPFLERPGRPLAEEATPADVVQFLRVFERHRARVERFFTVVDERDGGAPYAPDDVAALRRFISSMSGVSDFFAFFLGAREDAGNAVPVYDLQVQFRVNEDREVGANQIIEWRFIVDGDEIEPGDIDPPGRWTYGDPVRMTLRWAENAPTVPLDPRRVESASRPGEDALDIEGRPSAMKVAGRTVIFDYANAWSLLLFLAENAAAPGDFPGFADPHPRTLRLDIPAAPLVDSPAGDGGLTVDLNQLFTTQVFVRVTVMTPDGEKKDLAVPDFPERAPAFP